jgi:GNAT superfamily N-acetyltransferase
LLKALTRQSVEDAPYAFGGAETLADVAARSDQVWQTLAAECAGLVPEWQGRCVGFIVEDGPTACAKMFCFLCPRTPRRAYVTAVWVAPPYRRQGVGRRLLDAARAWAAEKGCDHLRLWVDETNPDGAAFYRALGFRPTGARRPVSPAAVDQEGEFGIPLSPV